MQIYELLQLGDKDCTVNTYVILVYNILGNKKNKILADAGIWVTSHNNVLSFNRK